MKYFPSFFNIAEKNVVVFGGGEAALRKARLLLKAKPSLTIVAPKFSAPLKTELADQAQLIEADFLIESAPSNFRLAIVATENSATDEKLARKCREEGIPVNVVDTPHLSDFIVPSIVERGNAVIGISTGGMAPVLGRWIRTKIENALPQRLSALASLTGQFRDTVAAKLPASRRRQFWEHVISGPISKLVLSGQETAARAELIRDINNAKAKEKSGFVSIVGAGPGDPELLTIKAMQALQDADVILYDRLVTPEILDLARRDAERIFVGKRKAQHFMDQGDTQSLMIQLARKGKHVVRLKGGDPFVFGRGGEEISALRAANIHAEIVPGITAATGCAASTAIPLTLRGIADGLTIISGHAQNGDDPNINWKALAELNQTIAIYMGLSAAREISTNFMNAGKAADTPVAIIENGTRTDQKTIITTLSDLTESASDQNLKGPVIFIVGDVVSHAHPHLVTAISAKTSEGVAA